MSGVGRRGEGPLSLCLPILPLPGGLKVPPSRAKGGGGDTATVRCVTRRQMSPPPSAAACEVRGERCAQGGDGRDSVTLGTAAGDRDTDTDHRVLWGHRGRGQQGSMGCSREAETCFWRGEGSWVGGSVPPGVLCLYPLSTPRLCPWSQGHDQSCQRGGSTCWGKGGVSPCHKYTVGINTPNPGGVPRRGRQSLPIVPTPPHCHPAACTLLIPSQLPSKEVGLLSISAYPTSPAPLVVFNGRKRRVSDNSFLFSPWRSEEHSQM